VEGDWTATQYSQFEPGVVAIMYACAAKLIRSAVFDDIVPSFSSEGSYIPGAFKQRGFDGQRDHHEQE
jgi:hypothetical protein